MNEPKYTPGPWAVLPEECDKPYIRVRGTRLGGRYKIANVLTPVYEGAPDREANETRANARLIAAAPDLLEAAAAVVARWDTPSWKDAAPTGEVIARLRAAIAKARGEQQ